MPGSSYIRPFEYRTSPVFGLVSVYINKWCSRVNTLHIWINMLHKQNNKIFSVCAKIWTWISRMNVEHICQLYHASLTLPNKTALTNVQLSISECVCYSKIRKFICVGSFFSNNGVALYLFYIEFNLIRKTVYCVLAFYHAF
jgi:hypothetical protein